MSVNLRACNLLYGLVFGGVRRGMGGGRREEAIWSNGSYAVDAGHVLSQQRHLLSIDPVSKTGPDHED